MTDKPKAGLIEFEPHGTSFARRYVEAVFASETGPRTGDIFEKAFSDNGYAANIVDAQHWAVEILKESGLEPVGWLADLDLISEIFFKCFIPYRNGELDLETAKNTGVQMADEFFNGTDHEVMFNQSPESSVWHAAHIYRLCEEVERHIKEETDERAELDELIGNVDDYYLSSAEDERNRERRFPFNRVVNAGVKIGFLYRDAWWKENHEEAALNFYAQVEARKKGSPRGGDATAEKFSALKKLCLSFFEDAYEEKGVAFLGAPIGVVSQTIREIALREKPSDFIGPQGKPLSQRWFLETLEDFQANGEFGPEILRLTKKALGHNE